MGALANTKQIPSNSKRYFIVYWVVIICILSILLSLSHWQLKRASYFEGLKQDFLSKQSNFALNNSGLVEKLKTNYNYSQNRFTRVSISGIVSEKNLLLDNQVLDKSVGFRVLSLLKLDNHNYYILIDRGFISRKEYNKGSNSINNSKKSFNVDGIINQPATGILLKEDILDISRDNITIQSIDYINIANALGINLLPATIQINESYSTLNYKYVKPNYNINPEKNYSYSVQWFIFAIITMIYGWIKRPKKGYIDN